MREDFYKRLESSLDETKSLGKHKKYRVIESVMGNIVKVKGHKDAIIMCSNNYVGLANNDVIKIKAKETIDKYGLGASSVRFICGTYDLHEQLEQTTAKFLGMESCLSYTSCWAANTAAIPALIKDGDAIISDELNHASIIDGVRATSKGVKRYVYKHSDMLSLEEKLIESKDCATALIITDGVFSMEGDIGKLPEIVALAKKYNALVMVDDSHATGAIGATGRGTMEYYGLTGGVDIISGTYGKALGGAGGGFIAASASVIDTLIQSSRPSLFSNALPPVLCTIATAAIDYLDANPQIVASLKAKTNYLKQKLIENNMNFLEGDSAIVPLMIYDTKKAIDASTAMLEMGLYAVAFGFPVVPEGQARIRLQVSDALTYDDIDRAVGIITNVLK